jgi:hypothetical protein
MVFFIWFAQEAQTFDKIALAILGRRFGRQSEAQELAPSIAADVHHHSP